MSGMVFSTTFKVEEKNVKPMEGMKMSGQGSHGRLAHRIFLVEARAATILYNIQVLMDIYWTYIENERHKHELRFGHGSYNSIALLTRLYM